MVTLKGDPVYAVTKVYALKSFLLAESALEELAYAKNLTDFVDILRPTHYGPFLSQLQRPYTAAEVEKALWRGLVDHHHKLIQSSLKPEMLQQLFMRYVNFNLKTILKSKALGKPIEEIIKNIDLYPETLLGIRDRTIKALNAKDFSEFLYEFLQTPLSGALKKAVEVWNEKRDFSALDAVLDKHYLDGLTKTYSKLSRDDRKLLQRWMFLEIDVKAFTTAMRARFWGLKAAQLKDLLPTKTVTLDLNLLSSLVEAEDVKRVLEQLPENELFEKITGEHEIQYIISTVEEKARKLKIKWAFQSFYKTPFKQTLLVSYLVLKENEVRNLSTIAKYIEEGVSDAVRIKSSLSLP